MYKRETFKHSKKLWICIQELRILKVN